MKNTRKKSNIKYVKKGLFIGLLREYIAFGVGVLYLLWKLLIEFIRNSGRFIVGFICLLFWSLKAFNKVNVRLFNLLSKPLKTAFIYALIVALIIAVTQVNILRNEVNAKTIEDQEQVIEFKFDIPKQNPVIEAQRDKSDAIKERVCENAIACDIYEAALNGGLSTETAVLMVSISKHETGHWSSNLFVNYNNFCGRYKSGEKRFYTFNSYEEGLNDYVEFIKNKYANGYTSIEAMGNIYAPIGADNDPDNQNIHWIPTVTQFYNEYMG